MEDLFEKLKAEPPINRAMKGSDSPRRESLPALKPALAMPPVNKSRSMSPTNCNVGFDKKKVKSSLKPENIKKAFGKSENSLEFGSQGNNESPRKQMPTKAQQKLFEQPIVEIADTKVTTDIKLKPFKVRIKRDDLEELSKKFAIERSKKQKKSTQIKEKANVSPPKEATKRKSDNTTSPPTKKGRSGKESPPKKNTGFFIKLNSTIPSVKKPSPNKASSNKSLPNKPASNKPSTNKKRSKSQSPTAASSRKINARAVSSSPVWTTKATKFTRTQLIKNFGKRFFNSMVRIERCKHPLMLMFEFNARARKQQTKNKSKNLSVSFKEQVEIIGGSDTESNYSDENVVGAKSGEDKSIIATPARLKKVENGKVIDDIEFDPALFIGTDVATKSSTPLRKKTEKKSYSPLKDENSSSARSELLKLANEKLPPCGLRRLRDATVDDDDDEDDECEYIVPIDMPDKRSSRANSLNNPTDSTLTKVHNDEPETNDADESDKEKSLSINSSSESFVSCTEEELKTQKYGNDKDIIELSMKGSNETLQSSAMEKQNNEKNIEKSQSLKNHKTTLESLVSEKQNDIELINGNGIGSGTSITDSVSKENKSSKIRKTVEDGKKSTHLTLDNDSSALTPAVSFTSDSQDNTSESIVKTVIDNLSKDNKKLPEISSAEEKEQSTTVKSIKTERATPIST